MPGRTAISVRDLGKRYLLGESFSENTARDALASGMRRLLKRTTSAPQRKSSEFWALKDVSFDVAEGEVLGIIGANGAGKSTLLKILSQITEPTTGEVRIRGRVASLLEVGTGFHQELSGRENVFMNGAILGMSQAEIRRKFDEIVDFAGVAAFIDTPVKRYSSGMLVRLGFAVAAQLESEVLVVDEVLAVGDAQFQQKCLQRMDSVSKSGRTVFFVSHNMAAIEALCPHSLVLAAGQVIANGSSDIAIKNYHASATLTSHDVDLIGNPTRPSWAEAVLAHLSVLDPAGQPQQPCVVGKPTIFRVNLRPRRTLSALAVGIHFHSNYGQRVMTLHSAYQAPALPALELTSNASHDVSVQCECPSLLLSPGVYNIVLDLAAYGERLDRVETAMTIQVSPSDFYSTGRTPPPRDGVFWPEARWSWTW